MILFIFKLLEGIYLLKVYKLPTSISRMVLCKCWPCFHSAHPGNKNKAVQWSRARQQSDHGWWQEPVYRGWLAHHWKRSILSQVVFFAPPSHSCIAKQNMKAHGRCFSESGENLFLPHFWNASKTHVNDRKRHTDNNESYKQMWTSET